MLAHGSSTTIYKGNRSSLIHEFMAWYAMNSSAPTSISDSGRETQKSKPMNRTMKFA
jgi:hypothetical protein